MPIYEFKCTKCETFFELLVMTNGEDAEMKCPKCGEQSFERVLSTMNVKSGGSSKGGPSGSHVQERSCSSGSCSTYTIPGAD